MIHLILQLKKQINKQSLNPVSNLGGIFHYNLYFEQIHFEYVDPLPFHCPHLISKTNYKILNKIPQTF